MDFDAVSGSVPLFFFSVRRIESIKTFEKDSSCTYLRKNKPENLLPSVTEWVLWIYY